MEKFSLPPILLDLHQSLSNSIDPDARQLEKELAAVSRILAFAYDLDPKAYSIRELLDLRHGFTGSGGNKCKCCGRPFPSE